MPRPVRHIIALREFTSFKEEELPPLQAMEEGSDEIKEYRPFFIYKSLDLGNNYYVLLAANANIVEDEGAKGNSYKSESVIYNGRESYCLRVPENIVFDYDNCNEKFVCGRVLYFSPEELKERRMVIFHQATTEDEFATATEVLRYLIYKKNGKENKYVRVL